MDDSRKLPLKQLSYAPTRSSPDARLWQKYRRPVTLAHEYSVNAVSFSGVEPYPFAIAVSTKVILYEANRSKPIKVFSRFKEVVNAVSIREDGKILAAGGDDKKIQLFDLNSRTILRTMKGHQNAVQAIKFVSGAPQMISASKDKTLKLWDVAEETCVKTFEGHTDYVRALSASSSSPFIWSSASYDHHVKLWDIRCDTTSCQVLDVNHGAPVEDVASIISGYAICAVGGEKLAMYDVTGGGKVLRDAVNHQKAITCITLDSSNSYAVTGGLDHFMKVYKVEDFSVVHSIQYDNPILCNDLSPDDSILLAGMVDGKLTARRHIEDDPTDKVVEKKAFKPRGGTRRYFTRGKGRKPSETDFAVEQQKRVSLKPYERHLRKYQYREALDATLATNNPVIVVSMLEELMNMNGLRIALCGRDSERILPILAFISKYISSQRYNETLMGLFDVILDLYGDVVGQSDSVDELLVVIHEKIKRELRLHDEMCRVMGLTEMLMGNQFSR